MGHNLLYEYQEFHVRLSVETVEKMHDLLGRAGPQKNRFPRGALSTYIEHLVRQDLKMDDEDA